MPRPGGTVSYPRSPFTAPRLFSASTLSRAFGRLPSHRVASPRLHPPSHLLSPACLRVIRCALSSPRLPCHVSPPFSRVPPIPVVLSPPWVIAFNLLSSYSSSPLPPRLLSTTRLCCLQFGSDSATAFSSCSRFCIVLPGLTRAAFVFGSGRVQPRWSLRAFAFASYRQHCLSLPCYGPPLRLILYSIFCCPLPLLVSLAIIVHRRRRPLSSSCHFRFSSIFSFSNICVCAECASSDYTLPHFVTIRSNLLMLYLSSPTSLVFPHDELSPFLLYWWSAR